MRSSLFTGWRRPLALVAATVAVAALAGCGGSSSSSGDSSSGGGSVNTKPASGTIDVWLAGLFATATPGTAYRDWVDAQDKRFEEAYPGSKVNITLLPANNDQFSAKLQAAFTSGQVPDVMLIYSGGYTTPYIPSLLELNKYVDANSGMYDSISNWDLSCADLRLPGRQREDLRRADRLRLLRAVLQQVDAVACRRLGAADDIRRAARRVRQAEGGRRHPDRLRRP